MILCLKLEAYSIHFTNSIEALSESLCNWGERDGAVIIVSHDKAFCDTISFTHVGTVMEGGLTVEERGLRQSDWDTYNLEAEGGGVSVEENKNSVVVASSNNGSSAIDMKDDKKSRNEQKNLMKKLEREIEKIESEIQKLKPKKEAIQSEIDLSSDKGWSILALLTEKLNKISEEIESKEARWLELSDQLDAEKTSVKQ